MQETIYEHVAGDKTFTVTAAERWSVGLIRRLKERYPDEVDITYENKDGSLLAQVPLEWMRIVPKKRMNDEQKEAAARNLNTYRPNSRSTGR